MPATNSMVQPHESTEIGRAAMQNQVGPASRQLIVTAGKSPFKEKFVSLYEDIFALRSPLQIAKSQGIQGRATIGRFWDELLLLKIMRLGSLKLGMLFPFLPRRYGMSVIRALQALSLRQKSAHDVFVGMFSIIKRMRQVNEAFLAQCISKASEEQLQGSLRPVINDLFKTCVRYLSDDNFIRVAHALETLAVLLREIFKKRFNEQGSTILTLVAGAVDNADNFFRRLITGISSLLTRDDLPVLVKSLGIKVYLTILTATNNVNTNSIASYLFVYNIFDAILAVFSIKLSTDRRKLELEAALVLILLLFWRESSNLYAERLLSPVAPISPLLNTVASLLSPAATEVSPTDIANFLSSPSRTVTDGGVLGYISSLFGFGAAYGGISSNGSSGPASNESVDVRWCNSSAGLLLLYFLFYLNPVVKTSQVWPVDNVYPVQGSGAVAAPGPSAVLLWGEILRSFLFVSKEVTSQLPTLGVEGVLRAKLCLTICRCMVEDRVGSDFLLRCDVQTFTAHEVPTNGLIGIPYVIQFRSVSCLMIELAVNVLATKPAGASHFDTDLMYRAAVLVSIFLNSLKAKGLQLSSTSLNWFALWDSLLKTCEWCSEEKTFQSPGVPELAGLVLGIMEMCLGSSPEFWAGPDETERLHAMTMAHMMALERLVRMASASPLGETAKAPTRGRIQLVNVAAVKYHYEVQIAALGVHGQPSMEQALLGVRKKGTLNLKVKTMHAGPGHSYTEGTSELRVLNNLARAVLVELQKQPNGGNPKQELEAL